MAFKRYIDQFRTTPFVPPGLMLARIQAERAAGGEGERRFSFKVGIKCQIGHIDVAATDSGQKILIGIGHRRRTDVTPGERWGGLVRVFHRLRIRRLRIFCLRIRFYLPWRRFLVIGNSFTLAQTGEADQDGAFARSRARLGDIGCETLRRAVGQFQNTWRRKGHAQPERCVRAGSRAQGQRRSAGDHAGTCDKASSPEISHPILLLRRPSPPQAERHRESHETRRAP